MTTKLGIYKPNYWRFPVGSQKPALLRHNQVILCLSVSCSCKPPAFLHHLKLIFWLFPLFMYLQVFRILKNYSGVTFVSFFVSNCLLLLRAFTETMLLKDTPWESWTKHSPVWDRRVSILSPTEQIYSGCCLMGFIQDNWKPRNSRKVSIDQG